MKTNAEEKFNHIVKYAFHQILKPLGYKKKNNNFYKPFEGFGHMVNLQKSIYYSKEHLHFTINIGLFLPEFYKRYFKTAPPAFPSEPDCVVRKRIGWLLDGNDKWWDVNNETDSVALSEELKIIVSEKILPFLDHYQTKADILSAVSSRFGVWTKSASNIVLGKNN
ncbi:DUF4304 domain-containing protein [Rhodocytophaga rosea]|uniref:DUF4304 domain-containing protein n=1 Tax=Rhodocytophaga rosea TaxID=2704465 RepID=A0A6C0GU73_9BACT|nr:DUF4304 domain-containing protein [Rhodocytophaga rosea]QHT71374.1 DUF4304 domain-containing protein [Rhodocytophaga rosea]